MDFDDSPTSLGGDSLNDRGRFNSTDAEQKKRKYVFYGAIAAILIGVALTIAGSVMLGIGVNKSSKTCPSVSAAPMYVTLESSKISYQDVLSNYQNAVQTVQGQIRSGLTGSGNAAVMLASVQTDPVITILGLSPSPNGVMAVAGLAYTNQDVPPVTTLQKQLASAPKLVLYHATDQSSPPTASQQMCNTVNQYTNQFTTQPQPTTTTKMSTGRMPTTTTSLPATTTTHSSTKGPASTTTQQKTTTTRSNVQTKTTKQKTTTTSAKTTQTNGVPTHSSTTARTTTSKMPSSTTSQKTTSSKMSTTAPVTSPTMATTSTPATIATTQPPVMNMRDIVLLIDDSSSMTTSANYKQVTNWLVGTLFPQWPVDFSQWEVAPVQYATNEYNLLMDFDETSRSELNKVVINSVFSGRNAPSVKKALKSTLGLTSRRNVTRVVVLISSSSQLTDIEAAAPYAKELARTGQVITLSVGSANGGLLGLLSSDPQHSFASPTFSPSLQIAEQITNIIAGGTVKSTTSAPSTSPTTPPLVDLPCHPDVAIIFDQSRDVGSNDEYAREMSFISSTLVPSWPIGLNVMEAEVVDYNSVEGGFIAPMAYAYKSAQNLHDVVQIYNFDYDRVAAPSIAGSFQFLASTIGNRRPGRFYTTLLFTYSSDYADVMSSLSSAPELGNIVIVGMGNASSTYLKAITGDVITNMDYGSDMVKKINTMLCNPSPAVPIPTTTVPATSPATSPKVHTSSTTAPSTSPPMTCPDCYPEQSNILIVMDASSSMTDYMFSRQQYFITNDLTPGWNHWERVAILAFDDEKHFENMIDFGNLNSAAEFNLLVNKTVKLQYPPSLTSAFKHALTGYNPLSKYGSMQTILFTSSSDPADVQNAMPYAKQLQNNGLVTIIGLQMNNASSLSGLSSHGGAIAWPKMSNDTGIAGQIEKHINPDLKSTTSNPRTSTTSANTPSTQPQTTASPGTSPTMKTSTTSMPTTSGQPSTSTTRPASTTSPQPTSTTKQSTAPSTSPTVPVQTSSPVPSSTTSKQSTSASTSPSSTSPTQSSSSPMTSPSVASTSQTVPSTSSPAPTKYPLTCSRDVMLLIDESSAIPDQQSFDKLKSWLISSLLPIWPVNSALIAVAPFGFTNNTWDDLGGDFVEKNSEEVEILLKNGLIYKPTAGAAVFKAVKAASSIQTPRAAPATIIISASDVKTDVTAAMPYASTLKQNGGTVITLTVGTGITGNLGKLSSGLDFTFHSSSFDVSQTITYELTKSLCSSVPLPSTTVTTPTTSKATTSVPNIFPCNPDIAILIDNSGEQQTETQYHDTVHFIGDQLTSAWPVGSSQTEAAVVVAMAAIGQIAPGAWSYNSHTALQNAIDKMDDEYYGGKGSITGMLSYLQTIVHTRRTMEPLTVIMFTTTSTSSDVYSALPLVQQLNANIIIVGVGNAVDPNLLGLLSGHVFTNTQLNQALVDQINTVVCSPTSPNFTPTVNPPTTAKTTHVPSTSTSPTTHVAPITTTAKPGPCTDCYPEEFNILIVMDASSVMTDKMFSEQKQLVTSYLTPGWNHLERVALLAFDDEKHFEQMNDFGDLKSLAELNILVTNTVKMDNPPSLTSAFKHALNGYHPLAKYGQMQTIIFTSTSEYNDVESAAPYSRQLQAKGKVIIVGLQLPDVSVLSSLASPNSTISWPEMDTNYAGIAAQIEKLLSPDIVFTTSSPSSMSTSKGTSSPTAKTTSAKGSTSVTKQPTVRSTQTQPSTSSTPKTSSVTSPLSSSTTTAKKSSSSMTTKPQSTSPVVTTQPKTQPTSGAPSTQQTPYPLTCNRDVLLLIDESSAVPDQTSFGKLQNWLINTLLPLWTVPGNMKIAPFGYTNNSFDDFGGDFLETSVKEVQTLLQKEMRYQPTQGAGITKALKSAAAVAPTLAPLTILISASDAASDVQNAMPYATSLKKSSGTVITLAVGSNIQGNLAQLASGSAFNFYSPSFDLSSDLAMQITKSLCTSVPIPTATSPTTPRTTPPVTTTVPNIFPCNPDLAILIDNSGEQQSETQFHDLVHYIGDQLTVKWPIDPVKTESAVVVANAAIGLVAPNPWSYASRSDLQTAIDKMDEQYYGGKGSITQMLFYLERIVNSRRQHAPLNAIMFTYTSKSDDVYKALPLVKQLNVNLIIVGLGDAVDQNLLGLLSGHVITGIALGETVTNMIQSSICYPANPLYTPTVNPPTTVKTIAPAKTTTPVATTTPAPTTSNSFVCANCYPDTANLLIMIDNSNGQDPLTMSKQKEAVHKLVGYWNHLERVSLATYSNVMEETIAYLDLSPNETVTLQKVIDNVEEALKPADIAHSLKMATGIVPIPRFGQQHTILFTTTSNASDIAAALQPAQQLQNMGAVTVVGVGMSNVTSISALASTVDAIAWKDVTDTDTVVRQIMNTLSSKPFTTANPGAASSSTNSQTSTTPKTVATTTPNIPSTSAADVFIPSKANIVFLLDASSSAKNYIEAQKSLMTYLTANWTHFERVAMEEYYSQHNPIAEFGDLRSSTDLQGFLQAFNEIGTTANITNVLKKVKDAYPVQPGFTKRNLILLTSSRDPNDIARAQTFAHQLQGLGNVVVVGINMSDSLGISDLASPNCALPWSDTTNYSTIASSIMDKL